LTEAFHRFIINIGRIMGKLIEQAKKYNLIRKLDYADLVDDSDWSGLIEWEQLVINNIKNTKENF